MSGSPIILDARAGNWVDRWAPARTRPYFKLARYDRLIGVWLLMWPCWWAIALGAGGWPDPGLLAVFAIGALVMRGAGCTFNDIVDRDFDGRVERTRLRPIPSGQVSVAQAVLILGALSLAGLAVLLLLNGTAIALGIGSLGLIAVYPFVKRFTYWPQLWLGITFNWGALMGWAAVRGTIDAPALWLYAAGIAWTLGYDTIYAHQDKDDDLLVGVKSTALKLGHRTRTWLAGFYTATVIGIAGAGWSVGLGWPFAIGLFALGLHLAWQVHHVDTDDPADCLMVFKSNAGLGWIVFAGLIAGNLVT